MESFEDLNNDSLLFDRCRETSSVCSGISIVVGCIYLKLWEVVNIDKQRMHCKHHDVVDTSAWIIALSWLTKVWNLDSWSHIFIVVCWIKLKLSGIMYDNVQIVTDEHLTCIFTNSWIMALCWSIQNYFTVYCQVETNIIQW